MSTFLKRSLIICFGIFWILFYALIGAVEGFLVGAEELGDYWDEE